MPHGQIGDSESAVSEIRKAITRARFLESLERVEEARLGGASSLSSLVESVLPSFGESRLVDLVVWQWDSSRAEAIAKRSDLNRFLNRWLAEHNLRVRWMRDIALFTLAAIHRRPGSDYWRIPPVLGASRARLPLKLDLDGWDAEFETRGAASRRLRIAFDDTLRQHLDNVIASLGGVAPRITTRHETRDLQWVAIHHVHTWSISKIAREWDIGNPDRSGGTGRRHVARRIEHWRTVLGLPQKTHT